MSRIGLILTCIFNFTLNVNAQYFSIKGKIENYNDSNRYLYIRYYSELLEKSISDSSMINAGKFSFNGEINMPTMAFVKLSNNRLLHNAAFVFLEPKDMHLYLDALNLRKAELTGSYPQRVYDTLRKRRNKLAAPYKVLLDSVREYGYKGLSAKTKTLLTPYYDKRTKMDTSFMLARANSIVTAFFIQPYFIKMPVGDIIRYYNGMGKILQNSIYGKQVLNEIDSRSRGNIGILAPDFSRKGLHMDNISLKQFSGKYVLLDFWASWCVPCRAETPLIKALFKRYHSRGLEIIGIADDDRHIDAWKKAIQQDGTGLWFHVLRGADSIKAVNGIFNPEDLNNLYGVGMLPTKLLIGPEGKIIFNSRKHNDISLKELLQKELGKGALRSITR